MTSVKPIGPELVQSLFDKYFDKVISLSEEDPSNPQQDQAAPQQSADAQQAPADPQQTPADPQQADASQIQQSEEQPPPSRIQVKLKKIPWTKNKMVKGDKSDFIPDHIRKRFQKGSKSIPISNMSIGGFPSISVIPTDRIFWGTDEPDLLNSLKSGLIKKMKLVGDNGMMVTKIEARGGGSFYAYMWMESLRCPLLRQLWGRVLDFSDEGLLSRRAASSYEIAKSCGLDDLTPPTVSRIDTDGDISSLLPDSLIENIQTSEWISLSTGKSKNDIRRSISGYAAIQLIRNEPWPIETEQWFSDLFGVSSNPDAMNNIWQSMPPDRRTAFLRIAALDFIIGNLDRSFGDFAFSNDQRHAVMVFGGELSCPCPRTIGKMYITGGYGTYSDQLNGDHMDVPLHWSEASTMLAARGGDSEISEFESICISIASRMRDSRPTELTRSLLDQKLTLLQIAGVLSRIQMVGNHGREIAKDPYFAARYYASLINGQSDKEMKDVEDFVNKTIKKSIIGDFDFKKSIKSDGV